jgi:hypothetical protein
MVIFGNCQAEQIEQILSALLPSSEFKISYLSNNFRTGHKKENHEIIASIRMSDYLIYQPLSEAHDEISEQNLKNIIKDSCVAISLPYIFNSGVYSLCYAPMRTDHRYGKIFGEEIIISLTEAGVSRKEVIDQYRNCDLSFNVVDRFNECFDIMKSREMRADIKICDFLEKNYKKRKLFTTHNHPANELFLEIIRKIKDLTGLPLDIHSSAVMGIPNLPNTNCPVTPYDIKAHGYEFSADEDWAEKGVSLIDLIIDHWLIERGEAPETNLDKLNCSS